MDPVIPAPILATTVPAVVSALEGDVAVLAIEGTSQMIRWPIALLPRGVDVGAVVYLRALSTAGLSSEVDEVARKVLEQLLN